MRFKDKTVLVSGGANGIGEAIAKAYLNEGAKVIIADIDDKKGNHLKDKYAQLHFYQTDFREMASIDRLLDAMHHDKHTIDILINNVGITKVKPVLELTIEEWQEVVDINLRSVFILSQFFAKQVKKGGAIVNISSTRSLMSEANTESYAASKGGIDALTHALAVSLSERNIVVNAIRPGWIATENYNDLSQTDHQQHPSNRVGKPEDIARMCLYLTDPNNDFITGEHVTIDGGMTKKMIYRD